ncbi:MAG: stage II sporulation protein M [Candidatus Aminicenantales bacterium]
MPRDYFPNEQTAVPKASPVKRIAAFYARQYEVIKGMRRYLRLAVLAFLLTTAAGTIFFLLKPDLALHWMTDYRTRYLQERPRLTSQSGTFFYIAINNLRATFSACLAGLLPLFLPAVVGLVFNTTLLCLIFVAGLIQHEPVITRFLTLILPHGIIEIPTMIFVSGFSLHLSSHMTKRLFRKKPRLTDSTGRLFEFISQENLLDRQDALAEIFLMFAAVILPLVVIAALIESFITPIIYRIFA